MRLFWPPGPPKRSIVANLASKMAPKWSPKWSQSDNGRPLRNMHRHCRIAHSPPLGELNFHCFFRDRTKVTKKHVKKGLFKIWRQIGPTSAPPGGGRCTREKVSFFVFFCSGGPWEPHWSTEPLKVTPGAPKCLPKLSKIIEQ